MSTPYRVIVNAMVGAGVERRRRWFVGTIFASLGDQFVHVSGSKIVEFFKVYSILRVEDWVQCVLGLGSYRALVRMGKGVSSKTAWDRHRSMMITPYRTSYRQLKHPRHR